MPFSLTDVNEHCLPNGLRVLIREDHSVPIVTCMIWYRVGPRQETKGITGISHFIEHMMFKGTKRFGKGEIDWRTAVNGGYNNAFTGHDFTFYYFTFASDRWWLSLEIEADRMVNSIFDEQEFELERQVIQEEWRMSMDDPWEAMRDSVDSAAFPGHPYGNPIIGRYEDIQDLELNDLLRFYSRYYRPSNATLVLVGDFETDPALAMVEQLFGDLGGTQLEAIPTPGEARRANGGILEIRKPSHLARLLVALPAPGIASPDLVAFYLLDKIISHGKLCRLFQRLIEREELVSLIDTEFEETIDPYHFLIRLELQEGVKPEKVISAVEQELDEICELGVDEDTLGRARAQVVTEQLGNLESPFDQAFQLGLLDSLDNWRRLNHFLERVEEVRPEDIQQVAHRYCNPADSIICTLLPEDEND